eukprot:TRINITY_DN18856_c0_g1_i1.p1 TRINITY_DN18856_c0_g1~~TRINITY_DN18856_c0_g1_i1.p1  ORF type:complete len:427 (-),score=53.86 TRINITY_DN18856_c0_g1_i1:272-1552(-)
MSGDAWDMERLMQGVNPPDLRPQVWCQVSGIHVREVNNEGLYGQLLQLSEQGVLSEECAGDIDRDVPRVASNDVNSQPALCRVLRAFCLWHPSVCYCQPLCFIGGFLLNILGEEHAFLGLVQLHISQCRGYWTRGMVGWKVDEKILTEQLKTTHPQLHSHISSLGVHPGMVFTPWIQTLFVSHTSLEDCARLWDVMLCSGVHFLHSVGLSAFRCNEARFMSAKSAPELFQIARVPIPEGELESVIREAVAMEPLIEMRYAQARAEIYSETRDEVKRLHSRHFREELQWHEPPPEDYAHHMDLPDPGHLLRRQVEHLHTKARCSPPATPTSKTVGVSRERVGSSVSTSRRAGVKTDPLSSCELDTERGLGELLSGGRKAIDAQNRTDGYVLTALIGLCVVGMLFIYCFEINPASSSAWPERSIGLAT